MNTGPRGGCTFLFFGIVCLAISLIASIVLAAELPVYVDKYKDGVVVSSKWHCASNPRLIYCPDRPRHGPRLDESQSLDKFGQYGDAYYVRRWKRMCSGSARYDAMREASDLGKGNPC